MQSNISSCLKNQGKLISSLSSETFSSQAFVELNRTAEDQSAAHFAITRGEMVCSYNCSSYLVCFALL